MLTVEVDGEGSQLLVAEVGVIGRTSRGPVNILSPKVVVSTGPVVVNRHVDVQLPQVGIITPGKDGLLDLPTISFK